MTAVKAEQTQSTPWPLLALLMATTAIGPATLNMLLPALPQLVVLLAAEASTVQLTLSLYLLSLAGAQLLLGPLSDRFGRRPVLLAGLALNVGASVAAIAANSITLLIAARMLQAVGASAGIVIGRAIIRDLFDRDRSAAMLGLITTAMVVAPMVAPALGGVLVTSFGWHAIFICIAILSAAVLVWAMVILPETHAPGDVVGAGALLKEWRELFRRRTFYGFVLAGALASSPFFTVIGGGPHVVVSQMHRSPTEYGLWFAVGSIGYMSGNFTVSRLSERLGVETLIASGALIEIVGAAISVLLVVYAWELGPFVIFGPQLVISYGNGLVLPSAIAGAISIRPQAAGSASGLLGFTQMALGAAATQIVPFTLEGAETALPMAIMVLAVAVGCGAAYVLGLRR
jgi:DHA1 family bicyclomycin/chloramphenicol resistance-like MFS transporter